MSNDLNRAEFIGRLGQDPSTRYSADGKAVTNLSIACGSSWRDKSSGEKQEKTEWIRAVAFGKLAEICAEYLRKGAQVYISGRMQTRKYEKDGVEKHITEVVMDQMQMLGGKKSDDSQPERAQAAKLDKSAPSDFDDDIPF